MHRLPAPSIAACVIAPLLFPVLSLGQGIRMSSDFLPLQVGNLWRYEITDPEGRRVDEFVIEITQYAIVDGASVYVFSQFPLAPGIGEPGPVGVRYDRESRQYRRYDGEIERDLFPSRDASAEVLENDDAGFPLRVRFEFNQIALTIERGVGILEAEYVSPGGARVVKLAGARVGGEEIGDLGPHAPRPAPDEDGQPEDTTNVSEGEPVLEVEASPVPGGHHLVLRVHNPSDKLLAVDFATSQSFDFVVTDPADGREVWRWSARRFFSQVVRSEAMRPLGEWTFEADWNHRDNELGEVPRGSYRLIAVLTSRMPIESAPIEIEVQ